METINFEQSVEESVGPAKSSRTLPARRSSSGSDQVTPKASARLVMRPYLWSPHVGGLVAGRVPISPGLPVKQQRGASSNLLDVAGSLGSKLCAPRKQPYRNPAFSRLGPRGSGPDHHLGLSSFRRDPVGGWDQTLPCDLSTSADHSRSWLVSGRGLFCSAVVRFVAICGNLFAPDF